MMRTQIIGPGIVVLEWLVHTFGHGFDVFEYEKTDSCLHPCDKEQYMEALTYATFHVLLACLRNLHLIIKMIFPSHF